MEKNDKKAINKRIIIIIEIIVIISIVVCLGIIINNSNKPQLDNTTPSNNTQDVEKTNENQKPDDEPFIFKNYNINNPTAEYAFLKDSNVEKILNSMGSIEEYVEKTLELAGYKFVLTDTSISYIQNNLTGTDLLKDENFRFSLAFNFGRIINKTKYIEPAESTDKFNNLYETGDLAIEIINFETNYEMLFSKTYKVSNVPSLFKKDNGYIVGNYYSMFIPSQFYDVTIKENEFNVEIYEYDIEKNGKSDNYIGKMQIKFSKNSNGNYYISSFVLSK